MKNKTYKGKIQKDTPHVCNWTPYLVSQTQLICCSPHSGISLWDCIVSNSLSRQRNQHLDLLQYYHFLTLPVHTVYIFLLSLVIVSLLDR